MDLQIVVVEEFVDWLKKIEGDFALKVRFKYAKY